MGSFSGQYRERECTKLVTYAGSGWFGGLCNHGSKHHLGTTLYLDVKVYGFHDVLRAEYEGKGGNRDLYLGELQGRGRKLGRFAVKVGSTEDNGNSSLCEVMANGNGFKGGMALSCYLELALEHTFPASAASSHVTILVEPEVKVAKEYVKEMLARFGPSETQEAVAAFWAFMKEVGIFVFKQAPE